MYNNTAMYTAMYKLPPPRGGASTCFASPPPREPFRGYVILTAIVAARYLADEQKKDQCDRDTHLLRKLLCSK